MGDLQKVARFILVLKVYFLNLASLRTRKLYICERALALCNDRPKHVLVQGSNRVPPPRHYLFKGISHLLTSALYLLQ